MVRASLTDLLKTHEIGQKPLDALIATLLLDYDSRSEITLLAKTLNLDPAILLALVDIFGNNKANYLSALDHFLKGVPAS
jgi:hypothetical protein